MKTADFDYHLPENRIAQHSVEPRDTAQLLVLNRTHQTLTDRHVFDLPSFLQPGDLIVLNNSKVFKARLEVHRGEQVFEIFLLRPNLPSPYEGEGPGVRWLALAKPAKKLHVNDQLFLNDGTSFTVINKQDDGTIVVDFQMSVDNVFALTDRLGQIPIPPYVDEPKTADEYQTIYAKTIGSVAAPTAGFHFTPKLFELLEQRGVKKAFVTLHVGLGTFRPMKSETLEEHVMHEEWVEVPEETKCAIEETKRSGGRVIAIGTTTVRALESYPPPYEGRKAPLGPRPFTGGVRGGSGGFTNLFITPGYPFKVIDGLVTNFHLPKSTLLVLVSAFAGREYILKAYQHAIDHDYRFYSFGDAMLIL